MQERSAWQYFTDCYTKNYANFQGRARRSEYWNFFLFYFLIYITLYAMTLGLGFATESPVLMGIFGLLLLIFAFGSLIPFLGVTVRRLHDTDKSGWMILIGLIPLIGTIILIVFYCTEGTRGPNQYGIDPKSGDVFEQI